MAAKAEGAGEIARMIAVVVANSEWLTFLNMAVPLVSGAAKFIVNLTLQLDYFYGVATMTTAMTPGSKRPQTTMCRNYRRSSERFSGEESLCGFFGLLTSGKTVAACFRPMFALDFSWSVKLELLWIVSLNQEVRGTTLVCHMGRSFPSLHSGLNPPAVCTA